MRARSDSPTKSCTKDGCSRPLRARGLCAKHYNERHRKPNPKAMFECSACQTPMSKERSRAKRYTNMFCDTICQAIWYSEHGQADAVVAYNKARPPRAPISPPPPTCKVYVRTCNECGLLFTTGHASRKSCTEKCSRRRENRYRKVARRGRRSIRRESIFIRDNYMCWMCETLCDPQGKVPVGNAPTVDHITPRSLGGGDEPDNLATACFRCNTRRGASWDIPISSRAA